MSGLKRRWRSLLLTLTYGWFAVGLSSSPYQPWLSQEVWQLLYWGATGALFWQWLKPTVTTLHLVFTLVPGVGVARGLAIWLEHGPSQGFTNSIAVAIWASAVYPEWRRRFDS